MIMNRQALTGLKVLEYGEFISAPYCGKMLADMGAKVIKVESPGYGDKARRWGPFPDDIPHPEKSGLFLFLNNNKHGITLNIDTGMGLKPFRRLVEWADVLVESNPPKEVERIGIHYENLARLNPSLVMTSITPFGQTGPYRDYKGCDLISSHMSGEASGNPAEGVDDIERYGPLKGPMHAADFMTGLTAAVSTISAVLARQASGSGRHIDISAQEALASVVRQEITFSQFEDLRPGRQKGRRRGGGKLYPCKDGHVCLWAGPHMNKLVEMIGNHATDQTGVRENPALQGERDFDKLIAQWTREHTTAEIDRAATAYSVPCSPVRSVKEIVADEQLAFRDFFVEIEHPEAGKLKYPGAPYKLSVTPCKIHRHAPLLGEHNEEVYCRILGYGTQELVRMRQAGII